MSRKSGAFLTVEQSYSSEHSLPVLIRF